MGKRLHKVLNNALIDNALSASNASGAAYGATAYKQGLNNGIKLLAEINQINQTGNILNKQDFD